jgi:hypothetical protein
MYFSAYCARKISRSEKQHPTDLVIDFRHLTDRVLRRGSDQSGWIGAGTVARHTPAKFGLSIRDAFAEGRVAFKLFF